MAPRNLFTIENKGKKQSRLSRCHRISFLLRPVPPFRLDFTVWALRRRPNNIVDRWDGFTYRRVVLLDSEPAEIEIIQLGTCDHPILRVTVICAVWKPNAKPTIKALAERMLGLRSDMTGFYKLLKENRKLRLLAQQFRGLKPPRFPSLFEALVNAIACQQLSLAVGITLLNRLAKTCGDSFQNEKEVSHSFPLPERLAALDLDALRALGFSRQKGQYLLELSRRVAQQKIDLDRLETLDNDEVLSRLYELRGVGRWTAEYVALRGLGRLSVFPGDDVGARNKLQRLLNSRKPLDYNGVRRMLTRWDPFAGLIYFHLLLDSLARDGYLSVKAQGADR
jgi:DNA-3-methyladenine glycosylase II